MFLLEVRGRLGSSLTPQLRLEAPLANLRQQLVDELLLGFCDRLFFTADAERDGAFFDFFLAEDDHVRDAFHAGVADFRADFVG